MKRTLVAVTAAALVAVPGVAAAAPINPSQGELQRELADQQYKPPAWMLYPPNHRHTPPYGPADIILGVTLVVGLVVLW